MLFMRKMLKIIEVEPDDEPSLEKMRGLTALNSYLFEHFATLVSALRGSFAASVASCPMSISGRPSAGG